MSTISISSQIYIFSLYNESVPAPNKTMFNWVLWKPPYVVLFDHFALNCENFGSPWRVGLQVWMAVLARRMRYGEASGWPEGEFLSAPAMPSGSKFLNLPPSLVIRDKLRPWSIGGRAGRCGHTTMLLIHGLTVSSLKLTLKMKRTSFWGEGSLYQIVIITEYGFSCL